LIVFKGGHQLFRTFNNKDGCTKIINAKGQLLILFGILCSTSVLVKDNIANLEKKNTSKEVLRVKIWLFEIHYSI
jgi:hypothetical protein